MTTINAKSTKAQLLQYIEELETSHAAISMALNQAQPVPFRERAAAVINEVVALVEDVYRLGAFCRKGFGQVVAGIRSLH